MGKTKSVSWKDYQWIHLTPPLSDEVLKWLKREFRFRNLDLEDCQEGKRQRPKWERYSNYSFFILHFPELVSVSRGEGRKLTRLKVNQLNVFVGGKFLVTIGEENPIIEEWYAAALSEKNKAHRWLGEGPGLLFYEIVDRLTDRGWEIIRELGTQINQIDREMFALERKTIDEITLMRRNLIVFNTLVKPMVNIVSDLEQTKVEYLNGKLTEFWSNVGDHLNRTADLIADHTELLDGLADAFDNLLTHRTNQTMRLLTVFSVLLLPLTLVSGIMGMNVNLPGMSHPLAFWWVMGGMAVAMMGMLGYFRAKRWL
jgi:magnesium transporter